MLKYERDPAYSSAHAHHISVINRKQYKKSYVKKIETLVDSGCLQFTSARNEEVYRIYRARFIDKLRTDATKSLSLCVAKSSDQSRGPFTAVTIIRRISLCLLFSTATPEWFTVTVTDIGKILVILCTPLRRPLFMQLPR